MPRGAGPSDLARAGQWPRFARFYLRSYAAAFEGVTILVEEAIDPSRCPLDGSVEVRRLERSRGGRRRWDASAFAGLDVVRAFQAPDLAGLPGPPPAAAATFGFDYDAFARIAGALRSPRARLTALRARAGARRAALLFVPAPFLAPRALRLAPGADSEPLPNGVDLEAFVPPERLGPLRRALCVARLEPQKDLPTLVRALSRLPRGSRPSLTLVGEGRSRRALGALAARLGVEADFRGVLPHDALPALYAAHDLFLLPSLEEGQPKALLEAMACGLACIVSDCEGCRALVEDGRSGWIHPRGDAGALAALVGRVRSLDAADLFRVRRAARRAVEEGHDLRALVDREVARVRDLARRASGSGLDAKYARAGAYHWSETDRRHLGGYNAPLAARYDDIVALAPRRCDRALDAGCGDGALSVRLLKRARRVVGCDPSLAALRLARARVPAGWWVCARLEALPFRAGAFDRAVAADVLEHVREPARAASELARVVAPGGELLASAPVAGPGDPRGRFHAFEFGPGGLAALVSARFDPVRTHASQAGWLLRLYRSRPLGRAWPKRMIDLLAIAGIDPFRWPAGAGARQETLRARARPPSPAAASAPEAMASAAQVAGDMNRK